MFSNNKVNKSLSEKISFYIRIKNNTVTTNAQGQEIDIDALFYGLKGDEQRAIWGKRKIWGHQLHLCGLRLADGDLLIVATDDQFPEDAIPINMEMLSFFDAAPGKADACA